MSPCSVLLSLHFLHVVQAVFWLVYQRCVAAVALYAPTVLMQARLVPCSYLIVPALQEEPSTLDKAKAAAAGAADVAAAK